MRIWITDDSIQFSVSKWMSVLNVNMRGGYRRHIHEFFVRLNSCNTSADVNVLTEVWMDNSGILVSMMYFVTQCVVTGTMVWLFMRETVLLFSTCTWS